MANTIDRFVSVGTALPDTAKVGKLFFLLGTPNKLYACKVANAWVEIGTLDANGLFTPATIQPSTAYNAVDGTVGGTGVATIAGTTTITFKNGLYISKT